MKRFLNTLIKNVYLHSLNKALSSILTGLRKRQWSIVWLCPILPSYLSSTAPPLHPSVWLTQAGSRLEYERDDWSQQAVFSQQGLVETTQGGAEESRGERWRGERREVKSQICL